MLSSVSLDLRKPFFFFSIFFLFFYSLSTLKNRSNMAFLLTLHLLNVSLCFFKQLKLSYMEKKKVDRKIMIICILCLHLCFSPKKKMNFEPKKKSEKLLLRSRFAFRQFFCCSCQIFLLSFSLHDD
jgi:hypothetical protein